MSENSQELKSFITAGGQFPLFAEGLLELLQAVLEKGKLFRFRAKGVSMRPCIKNLDVITIAPLPNNRPPRLGEIVLFRNPETGKPTVHRVLGRKDKGFLIKGDNAINPDGVIPRELILGFVTKVDRKGDTVTLGMGASALPIAILSRLGLLVRTIHFIKKLRRPFKKRKGVS